MVTRIKDGEGTDMTIKVRRTSLATVQLSILIMVVVSQGFTGV